jgi:ABC-type sugar transport system permease subunit
MPRRGDASRRAVSPGDRTAASHTGRARFRARRVLGPQFSHGLLFIAPFIVVFAAFTVWPNVNSLILSFQRYDGFTERHWVGLANYRSLLQYGGFRTEALNTIEYWLFHAVILIPIAFVLAVMVSSRNLRGRKVWQALIFLPQVMSIVAVTLVFQVLFSRQSGVVNDLFGLHVAWLTNFGIAKWVVVLLLVWQGLGFWFVVFVAGIASIDPEIDEAARMDGAGALRRMVSITLPLTRNFILFAVVIDGIASMALYTEPNVLLATNAAGAPPRVAPLSNLVLTNLLSGSYGQSAAAGWMLFILTIAVSTLIFGINRLVKGGRDG